MKDRAKNLVDQWETEEGESMREGHRATLERLLVVFGREERRLERERCLEWTAQDGYDCDCYQAIRALGAVEEEA